MPAVQKDDFDHMDRFDPRAAIAASAEMEAAPNETRRSGRLDQEMVVCRFGPVTNLSVGGMRAVCRKVPAGELDLMISCGEERVVVRARAAWSKRIGLFKHEVGFQFVDVSPEQSKLLTALATVGRLRRST